MWLWACDSEGSEKPSEFWRETVGAVWLHKDKAGTRDGCCKASAHNTAEISAAPEGGEVLAMLRFGPFHTPTTLLEVPLFLRVISLFSFTLQYQNQPRPLPSNRTGFWERKVRGT